MIIEKLCENKNKPGMHCNGHCYLSKQLKKTEEKEQQSSNMIKEKEELISTVHPLSAFTFLSVIKTEVIASAFASPVFSPDHAFRIIQPPELV